MKAKGGARSAVDFAEFVENELSKSLDFLGIAVNDRSAGNVAAANSEELSAHRAYHEALYLLRVLRPRISHAEVRRLAIRIREIKIAMQEG